MHVACDQHRPEIILERGDERASGAIPARSRVAPSQPLLPPLVGEVYATRLFHREVGEMIERARWWMHG